MNSTKIYQCSLLIMAVLISACGGSKIDHLEKAFSVRGESYCEETNDVVNILLQYHLTKSEADRENLYKLAIERILRRLRQSFASRYDLLRKIDDLEAKMMENGRFQAQRLSDCKDIVEIHKVLVTADQTDGEIDLDERTAFWMFLSYFANSLDFFSAYQPPIAHQDEEYNFGIRLDLDLASHYNHIQKEAKVLAVKDESLGLKPGDRIVGLDAEFLSNLSSSLNPSFNSIEDITRAKLGRLLNYSMFASPEPQLSLTFIPKDAEDFETERITIYGEPRLENESSRPLVQAEINNNIIYVRLFEFGEEAAEELATKLSQLRNEWLREPTGQTSLAILLDLRFNPGGSVEELRKIAGMFVPAGILGKVRVRDKTNAGVHYYDEDLYSAPSEEILNEPLIILANNASASAADLLTQFLSGVGRAFFVGMPTFGKGIGQSVISLGPRSKLGGILQFTAARYYGPDGSSVQNNGDEPDLTVEDPLVAQLMKACKSDESKNCRFQFMKDLPEELRIAGGRIAPIDKPVVPLSRTEVSVEVQQEALRRMQEQRAAAAAASDLNFDPQRRVGEEILQILTQSEPEPVAEEI